MHKLRYAAPILALGLLFSAAVPAETATYRHALLKLHNDARKCSPLKMSDGANAAALYHARDMAEENYFSHDSQHPRQAWDKRIERFTKHQAGGENIAYGQDTAAEVFRDWMDSPGHRRNIVDCSFERVGFGYAERSGRTYWVADFLY